jgi:hypothetical protein
MRSVAILLAVAGILGLAMPAAANTTGFYAVTNGLGYQGDIWNITDGTGPWATATPRVANLYLTVGLDGEYGNWNQLASSWSEHAVTNQNNSFVQLAGTATATGMTSAVGGWDPSLKVFTVTVTGTNAPYPWSRMWQADNGVAWGVTFTDYTYSFVATFANEAVLNDGWLLNNGAPTSIVGSFSGQFVVTADPNKVPISNGDLYGFSIGFNSTTLFPGLDPIDAYGNATQLYSEFGAAVPEPLTMLAVGSAVAGIGAYIRRRRAAA